jgi:methylase of polypeptide subunit release factors
MKAERFDTKPVELLLARHKGHQIPYVQDFRGLQLVILPEVFNPTYTKVSGFLADNLDVSPNSKVLEMFSGSGALSFIAAQKAENVVGIDISPHAVECSKLNAERLGLSGKTQFRTASLWEGVGRDEKFDTIVANPPLLPAIPENWLEMTVADSPEMSTTVRFLQGCSAHLTASGCVQMAFSNACKVYFNNPLEFISEVAKQSGLTMMVCAKWDMGYEVYRILEFRKEDVWQR